MPAGAQMPAGTADRPGKNHPEVFGTKTPDSVGVGPRGAEAEQPAAHKRKATAPPSKGRFKIVAQMIIAMRRFQASLNPTYTYGKQQRSVLSSHSGPDKAHDGEPDVTSRAFTKSASLESRRGGKAAHPAEHYAYADRGHRTDFLFKPLPPAPGEVQEDDGDEEQGE